MKLPLRHLLLPLVPLALAACAPDSTDAAPVEESAQTTSAEPAAAQQESAARPPLGKYAVYQYSGSGFAYQYRIHLVDETRYRQYDDRWGTYSFDPRESRLVFDNGPLQGFGGLFYTEGRNADGPTIALNPDGPVTDLETVGNGAYQYAFHRPEE